MDKGLATKSDDLGAVSGALGIGGEKLCLRVLTSTCSPQLMCVYSLNSLSLLSLSLPLIHTINSKCKIFKNVFIEHRTFCYI